ncbi:McrB family protein [Paraliobacillus sp. JSM ZJ581]|uniref:McrB family protein n=1 Tax=Paraliobacillus sp. JSM ZJ581 TaxID=3342118 RepID=UPI0035A89E3B
MKWSMDTHKYMSEITRTALKIIVSNNITSESSVSEIDSVERQLVEAGVYTKYESAKGRIRRALFTYFKAYGCMNNDESPTEMGNAFIEDKITIQEFSFWYVLNYKYVSDDTEYFPTQLILKFLKMMGSIDVEYGYISAHDFSHLVNCEKLSDINDDFIEEILENRKRENVEVNERQIGFDIWSKMLIQAGILIRRPDKSLVVSNDELADWILNSYEREFTVSKGEIVTGIIKYLPVLPIGATRGDSSHYQNESTALKALLFDTIDEKIIEKYILGNKKVVLKDMKKALGIDERNISFYLNFHGLEHIVGFVLKSNSNNKIKRIGEILISLELTEELLDEETDSEKNVVERLTGGNNTLLYGVPGSGKSYKIEEEYCNDFKFMERVVFHPDYMNTDFVGQILPTVKGEGDEKEITYDFTPGPFTRVLKKAIENPGDYYYLVIEEINRGNAPAIFGEIFQLLDRDDKGKSSYEITNYNIANEVFDEKERPIYIPSNLHILATMNTADQNVFTLDTAFQRRWNMKMIENDVSKAKHASREILDTNVTWKRFNTVINDQIITSSAATLSSEDKRLGAYFVTEGVLKYYSQDKNLDEVLQKFGIESNDTKKISRTIEDLNSRFGDKVIKYLWDDAFKFSRDDLFDSEYKSLEKVLDAFNQFTGDERFNIFNQDIKENLLRTFDTKGSENE